MAQATLSGVTPSLQQAPQSYALLTLDRRLLLLPQSEILTLEPVLDVEVTRKPAKGVGWLGFEGRDWPVYALDDDLNPLPVAPTQRRVCVLVNASGQYIGLICSSIATVRAAELRTRSLPAAMTRPGTLLRGLALHNDRLGVVSTGEALANYLQVGRLARRR
ncbi:MAG: hypothetical protein U1F68_15220 [Gammaproteobacteria bacterium]